MYPYTLGFIKRGENILLLNRNKQPWLGAWNGVGGKLELNETPLECMIREIYEETGIKVTEQQVFDCGYVTWNGEAFGKNGLYVFLIEIDASFEYVTPKVKLEGILDWKHIDFLRNKQNYGLADNIPYFIDDVLNKKYCHHQCIFDGDRLIEVKSKELSR